MKTTVLGREADTTELAANAVRMQIDENGFSQLMATLAGLYVNPPTAVLREYTSNALVSHVRAGVKRPVQITYTPLDQYGRLKTAEPLRLTIEDFGVGMDIDDLTNIYSKYGASTKRNSNQEIGGFGLGAKSALSITSTFTVRARKNGTEVTATVAKDKSGVGVLNFSPVAKTKAPNGVLVEIPLNKGHLEAIHAAVKHHAFFIGMPADSVLVNGQAPSSVHDAEKFLPVTYANEVSGWVQWHSSFRPEVGVDPYVNIGETVKFVVGGVVYPATSDQFAKVYLDGATDWWRLLVKRLEGLTTDRQLLYINLPIGGVDLAPNREGIQVTERSAATIRAVCASLFQLLPAAAAVRVGKQTHKDEALLAIAQNWRLFVPPTRPYPRSMSDSNIDAIFTAANPPVEFTWRGITVANEAPTPNGYAFVDAAAGEKISEEYCHGPVPVVREFINRRVRVKVKRMSRKNANLRIVVTAPKVDEETLAVIRREIRTFTEAKWQDKSVSAYVFEAGQAPEALTSIYPTVSVAQMIAAARDYRRQQAAGREKAPKKPLTYSALTGTGPYNSKLEGVLTTDRRIAEGVYFYAQDSFTVARSYDLLSSSFGAPKRSSSHVSAEFSGPLMSFMANRPVFIVPDTRSATALAKVFKPEQSLLHAVYQHALGQVAAGKLVELAAAVDLGYLLAAEHGGGRREWLRKLGLIAEHTGEIHSRRLRAVLRLAQNPTSPAYQFALVAGMINWQRFREENVGLDEQVLAALGDRGRNRLYSWFTVLGAITSETAGDTAFVLDSFAKRYKWQ